LIDVLRDPDLPYGEWNAQFSALHARMPQRLDATFTQIVDRAKVRKGEFPAKNLSKALSKFFEENVAPSDVDLLKTTLSPLIEVLDRYAEGQKVHEFDVFSALLDQYASVERLFSGRSSRDEEVILKLRDENKDDILNVVQTVLSHSRVGAKNNLILAILDEYRPNKPNVLAMSPNTSDQLCENSPS
jgi:acetyl-CoA carboxylase/biotin carboxylase 1